MNEIEELQDRYNANQKEFRRRLEKILWFGQWDGDPLDCLAEDNRIVMRLQELGIDVHERNQTGI